LLSAYVIFRQIHSNFEKNGRTYFFLAQSDLIGVWGEIRFMLLVAALLFRDDEGEQ
jgi:hypothetical protein